MGVPIASPRTGISHDIGLEPEGKRIAQISMQLAHHRGVAIEETVDIGLGGGVPDVGNQLRIGQVLGWNATLVGEIVDCDRGILWTCIRIGIHPLE